jgi:hypothetical protein
MEQGKLKAVEVRWNGEDWEPTGRAIPFQVTGDLPPGAELHGVSVQPETPGCKWIL